MNMLNKIELLQRGPYKLTFDFHNLNKKGETKTVNYCKAHKYYELWRVSYIHSIMFSQWFIILDSYPEAR